MRSQPYSGFSTPEMDYAARELDSRIDYAWSQAREVRLKTGDLEEKMDEQAGPPSDEDVDRIKKFVLGHARTDEWQPVIDMIDRGEVSWRQVVEGLASGGLDHRVAAAFESMSAVPPASMEQLADIGLAPEPPGEEPTPDEPEQSRPKPARHEEDDDSFFDDPLSWRG